jgi:Fe-S-cluster containining protein
MRLAELVPLAFELTDLLARRSAESERRNGRVVSCRAGCGACCRQMVPLSAPEVFHVGGVLAQLAAERQAVLRQRFESAGAVLERTGLRARIGAPELSEEEEMSAIRDYFGLGLPCPFLDDESCSIHARRPVACRQYSVTSPAEWCAEPLRHRIVRLPMPRPLAECLAKLAAEVTGLPFRLIPLTLAPVWARTHREIGERTWPASELFRRFMALAGVKLTRTGRGD